MDKDKTYAIIATKYEGPSNKTAKFEWERQPIVIKFNSMVPGHVLSATVSRFLPKAGNEKVAVRYMFACVKRGRQWRCSPDVIPDSKERQRHLRSADKRDRPDWRKTTERNCEAAERKMAEAAQIQEQIFASDTGKVKVTTASNINSRQTFTYWYSLGWLVYEVHDGGGQQWIWPVSEFASIEAARADVESTLAPKPRPFDLEQLELNSVIRKENFDA